MTPRPASGRLLVKTCTLAKCRLCKHGGEGQICGWKRFVTLGQHVIYQSPRQHDTEPFYFGIKCIKLQRRPSSGLQVDVGQLEGTSTLPVIKMIEYNQAHRGYFVSLPFPFLNSSSTTLYFIHFLKKFLSSVDLIQLLIGVHQYSIEPPAFKLFF